MERSVVHMTGFRLCPEVFTHPRLVELYWEAKAEGKRLFLKGFSAP